jgi:hypothetical protein
MRFVGLLCVLAACSGSSLKVDASDAAGAAVIDGALEHETGDAVDVSSIERGEEPGLCRFTNDRAVLALHVPNEEVVSCDGHVPGASVSDTWTGTIASSTASSLTITLATCGGDPSCKGGTLTVEATAQGLDLSTFPRVAVRVRASFRLLYVCEQSLEITSADGKLLLAVVDGGHAFDGAPYQVQNVPLTDCPKVRGCGAGTFVDNVYAFEFSTPGSAAAPLRVYMGQSVGWTSGGDNYTVQNLRSYQTGNCDDYWNWAYTVYIDPK